MNHLCEHNIKFYDSLAACVFLEPYAVLTTNEVEPMVRRFLSWLAMLEMHPKLAVKFGEELDAQIKLIRALPTAIETAKQGGIFPRVILSRNEFQASMHLYVEQGGAISSLPQFEF